MIEKLYTIKASVDSKRVMAEGLVKPLPAVEEAATRLSEFPQEVQIALVVADDLRGQ